MITFIRTIDDKEITFIVGKNQHENHPLIKSSEPDDFWFHLAKMSSAHVVAQVAHLKLTEEQELKVIHAGIDILKERMKINTPIHVDIAYIKDIICTEIPGQIRFVENSCQYLLER